MKSTKSAGRYAKALLELALDQKKIEVIESNMQQILTVAEEAHDFQVFLNSPLIKVDKKIEVIKSIFGNFDALSISFLELVSNNGRESYITEIAHSFLNKLKEHRLRDGAYTWGLFEDTSKSGRFIEYFMVESWLEHLRQHERVTHADAEVQATARSYHRGPDRPKVDHYIAANLAKWGQK